MTINPPITPQWKDHPKSWGHTFHPMCSYMAMFPPRLPHYFIQRFTNPGDRVLDPFSGRGTTPLQACVNGRIGIANDLNPLAFALSRAKVAPPDLDQALTRLDELQTGYRPVDWPPTDDQADISAVFHKATLQQLCYLRKMLMDEPVDNFIRAAILGIMHGKYRRKGDDSIYLSIDMPNTFSMSPRYIRNYVLKHRIESLDLDVFEKTRMRLKRLYRDPIPTTTGEAYNLNARNLDQAVTSESVALIFSSPPYLKVIKYGLYNWIRLWFLGEDHKVIDTTLDDGHNLNSYLTFMEETILSLERLLKPGGMCALVIGDVASPGKPAINLAWAVWDHIAKKTVLQNVDIVDDYIADHTKVTKIWNARRGRATTIDRILVLCKGDQPGVNHPEVEW
jgi:site-specific DNA-methyltransferase (adenine-specific)